MMEKTYVIAWKSKSSGSFGQSKKLFTREEAEQLAEELNQTHPNFIHEPLNLPPVAPAGPAELIANTAAFVRNLVFGPGPSRPFALPAPEAAFV